MIKLENGKVVENKMVDFQIVGYGSPAKDVVFFLFSSVQIPVLKAHCDEFFKVYHDTFLETLEELQCDTKPFSFKAFNKELDAEARDTQFFHLQCMLQPIYATKDDIKDMKDFCEEDLKTTNISKEFKEKEWFLIEEFAKRNWI